MQLDYHSDRLFMEFPEWADDAKLMNTIHSCLRLQWEIGKKHADKYHLHSEADHLVSPEALDEILQSGKDISDIRTHQELSNCIVFHTKNLDGSLIDEKVIAKRAEADAMIAKRIRDVFASVTDLHIEMSGHFWYPKGGFMGWHTNLRKPGWRMYVNYATEENRSFFRYRDPKSGEIVTSWDKHWNFRLFKISAEFPFWHCVRSETDRFSLGYKITEAES